MSLPATTVMTATVASAAAAAFLGRHTGAGSSPYQDRDILQDAILTFGVLCTAGALLGGIRNSDSVGRGLLWGAGGLAAAYGIDKALAKR